MTHQCRALMMLVALAPSTGLKIFSVLDRRAVLGALAPMLTPAPAHAFSDPLSRLVEATEKRREREAAAKALLEEDVPEEEEYTASASSVSPAQPGREPPAQVESDAGEAGFSTPAGLAKIDVEVRHSTGYSRALPARSEVPRSLFVSCSSMQPSS